MIDATQINEAVRRLAEGFQPDKIILFGSQARGTADDKSDADFLVIMPAAPRRRILATEMDWALSGLEFARDIVVLTAEEYKTGRDIPGTIARLASQEGRVLYERPE